MKRIGARPDAAVRVGLWALCTVFGISATVLAPSPAAAGEKRVIAVLEFERAGGPSHLPKAVADVLQTSLAETGQFRVVERRNFDKLTEELQKAMVGLVDADTAKDMGKALGAELMVMGSVSKLGRTITVSARLVDVETGEAVIARSVKSRSEDGLVTELGKLARYMADMDKGGEAAAAAKAKANVNQKAFHAVVDAAAGITLLQLNKALPDLRGKIVNSMVEEAEITLGKRHGVVLGMRFEVWGTDMMEGKVKKGVLRVTKVLDGRSKGKVSSSGMDMVEDGDAVQPARSRVVVGPIPDKDSGDEGISKAFTEELRKQLSGGKRMELASGRDIDKALGSVGADPTASFGAFRKGGADLYVEGKMYGDAGKRTVDLQVWNVHSGDLLTKLKIQTQM